MSTGTTRREFLQNSVLGAAGLALPNLFDGSVTGNGASRRDAARSAIMIFNVGGPSHLDLFDPKPDAPSDVRGPFRAIRTASPDIELTELLPLHAKVADKFSLVRSVYHTAAHVHDTGHQLMQTGRLFGGGVHPPHVGSVIHYLKGPREGMPAHVLLPGPIGATGGNLPHGQDAGFLGSAYDPVGPAKVDRVANPKASEAFDLSREPESVRERYGLNRFGESCLLARRLVEAGVRFVTVNAFTTVFNEITWDIHGTRPFSSVADMRDVVCPMYDRAYSALIEDLSQRGMLDNTLVCNLSEFGRTPRVNREGGRDHWPGCWTVYFAGGGVQGGRVIGRSDEIGAYPADRPVTPAEVVATIYRSLGVDLSTGLAGAGARPFRVVEPGARAVEELF